MWWWLIDKLVFKRSKRVRLSGQSCASCGCFTDGSTPYDDPDEMNGYCCNEMHPEYGEEYGGHWTHSEMWCASWEPKRQEE